MSELRTRERFPSTINKEHLAELRALSNQTGVPMSTLMDKALILLFDYYSQYPSVTPIKK